MSHYFISDLHLSPERSDLRVAYFNFCEKHLLKGNKLTILGDFFDAWVGDDEDEPFYLSIKTQLLELTQRGIEVELMHGNRDFLIGERFMADTGITLLSDPTKVNLLNTPCLLMHGDSLCVDDKEYIQFRAQVRSKPWQAHFMSMSLNERRAIAQQLREKSKSMSSLKSEDIMDVSANAVNDTFKQFNVHKIIHGHTHRPARHAIDSSSNTPLERIVLGDWDKYGWYLKVDKATGFETHTFSIA